VSLMAADQCVGAPVPPPPAAALEREKVAAGEMTAFTAGRSLPRATPGKGPHGPGGSRGACVGQGCEGSGLESRRLPKPRHRHSAGRRHRRLPVPTYPSLSLSPARTCPPRETRGARQQVGLASCGFHRNGSEEKGCGARFTPSSGSLPTSPWPQERNGELLTGAGRHPPPDRDEGARTGSRLAPVLWGGPRWHWHQSRCHRHCPQWHSH